MFSYSVLLIVFFIFCIRFSITRSSFIPSDTFAPSLSIPESTISRNLETPYAARDPTITAPSSGNITGAAAVNAGPMPRITVLPIPEIILNGFNLSNNVLKIDGLFFSLFNIILYISSTVGINLSLCLIVCNVKFLLILSIVYNIPINAFFIKLVVFLFPLSESSGFPDISRNGFNEDPNLENIVLKIEGSLFSLFDIILCIFSTVGINRSLYLISCNVKFLLILFIVYNIPVNVDVSLLYCFSLFNSGDMPFLISPRFSLSIFFLSNNEYIGVAKGINCVPCCITFVSFSLYIFSNFISFSVFSGCLYFSIL